MQCIGQVHINIIAFRDKSFAKFFIIIKTIRSYKTWNLNENFDFLPKHCLFVHFCGFDCRRYGFWG